MQAVDGVWDALPVADREARPTRVAVPTHCPCGITYVLERAAGRGGRQHGYGSSRNLVLTDKAKGS